MTESLIVSPREISPREKLETELSEAKALYDADPARTPRGEIDGKHSVKGTYLRTEATSEQSITKVDQKQVALSVCRATNLSRRMEVAAGVLATASRRAEEFLEELHVDHNASDRDCICEAEIEECTGLGDIYTSTTSYTQYTPNTAVHASPKIMLSDISNPVSTELHDLMSDLALLKVHVRSAKEEINSLRSSMRSEREGSSAALSSLDMGASSRFVAVPKDIAVLAKCSTADTLPNDDFSIPTPKENEELFSHAEFKGRVRTEDVSTNYFCNDQCFLLSGLFRFIMRQNGIAATKPGLLG